VRIHLVNVKNTPKQLLSEVCPPDFLLVLVLLHGRVSLVLHTGGCSATVRARVLRRLMHDVAGGPRPQRRCGTAQSGVTVPTAMSRRAFSACEASTSYAAGIVWRAAAARFEQVCGPLACAIENREQRRV
jgi:hypothetical protein